MRGFTRSAAGKVLLVIVFSICFGLGIVSMISGTVLVERNAYSVTAEEYMQSQRSRIISNEAQETVTSYVFNMEVSQEAAEEILCITRPDGSVLYQSSSWKGSAGKQADTEVASFYLVGVRSEEGYLLYEDWINPDSVPDAKQFAKEVAGEEGQIYDVKVDAQSCLRWAGVDYLYFRILIWIYGLRYAICSNGAVLRRYFLEVLPDLPERTPEVTPGTWSRWMASGMRSTVPGMIPEVCSMI